MNAAALVAGDGVRVGLEDNILHDGGRTWLATNKGLVERVLLIARALGRVPYSGKEVRERLGVVSV
jgi:3-keto-5-aminohexanoate cleavage enzyme